MLLLGLRQMHRIIWVSVIKFIGWKWSMILEMTHAWCVKYPNHLFNASCCVPSLRHCLLLALPNKIPHNKLLSTHTISIFPSPIFLCLLLLVYILLGKIENISPKLYTSLCSSSTYLHVEMVQQQLTVVVLLVEIVHKRRDKLHLNNYNNKKKKQWWHQQTFNREEM